VGRLWLGVRVRCVGRLWLGARVRCVGRLWLGVLVRCVGRLWLGVRVRCVGRLWLGVRCVGRLWLGVRVRCVGRLWLGVRAFRCPCVHLRAVALPPCPHSCRPAAPSQIITYPLQFSPFEAGSKDSGEYKGPELFRAAFLVFISNKTDILFWCAVGVVGALLLLVLLQMVVELRRYGLMLIRSVLGCAARAARRSCGVPQSLSRGLWHRRSFGPGLAAARGPAVRARPL
jgi:hypothetical protein